VLRHVDATRRPGKIRHAYLRLMGSRPLTWLSRMVAWKLDPILMRMSGGRLGLGVGLPTALLETRGARSGSPRRNGVIYFHDGERVTIIPSKAGAPEHPAWFHNLRANPDVVFGGQPFRAEIVSDEAERARLWALADNVFPAFATYRDRAARVGRTIPIVQLIPV